MIILWSWYNTRWMCCSTMLHLPELSRKLWIKHSLPIWEVWRSINLRWWLCQYTVSSWIKVMISLNSLVFNLLFILVTLFISTTTSLHHLYDWYAPTISCWKLRFLKLHIILNLIQLLWILVAIELHKIVVVRQDPTYGTLRLSCLTLCLVSIKIINED